ncbi:MAG: YaiO family outer membrane beta-barrel protein [Sulfurovum sp.]|nr:YaiO family outer membrane beta-barrel protein [Sulfurovum sp.]MBT8349580.1 YaiO family outer membrane beta-barrel protein [Sulfurovum sp.]NNJ46160.1 YaiO family outer membrane beta-barrel protein [Sulfurovum sp.]
MRFLVLIILSGILWADPVVSSVQGNDSEVIFLAGGSDKEIIIGQQDRLDVSFTYEYLDPSSDYGSWKNFNLSYYQKYSKELTLVYQVGFFNRNEGSATLFSLGGYKDWTPSLYTFSQLTVGTDSEYLPRYRLDHDFYYKFGERKQWVGILGFTYIDYYDEHSDTIASVGMTYYAPKYNLTYRFFANNSDPGSVNSNTHLLSMGYGAEKEFWTYLDISYGNQAYQSTLIPGGLNVDNDAFDSKLSHRHWLTENSGIFGAVGFFNLNDGYDKYLFQIGYFKEF